MATTMKLIAKQTLSTTAATVTFSSIPGTATDLVLVYSARTNRSAVSSDIYLQFNGITTATYSFRRIYGVGTSAGSDSLTNNSSGGLCGWATGANATASTFGNSQIYIPNYAGSTAKSFSAEGVTENNATDSRIAAYAGLWSGTSAITQIDLKDYDAASFVSGSSFYLYTITKS